MHTVNCRISTIFIAIVAAIALHVAPTLAAPQALGLVASNRAVPLTCHGRECWAEFSAFCLQPERRSPAQGLLYQLAEAHDLRLLGTTNDGREISLPVAPHLKITALRTHVAVRIAMAHASVGELGLKSVRVVVGEAATLLPAPAPGDANPQSAEDVELVSGPLRAVGQRIVDDGGARMTAARVTNRLINALPPRGRAAAEQRANLWRQAITEAATQSLPPAARTLAQGAYDDCQGRVRVGAMPSLRRCLESKHDSILGKLNDDYWWAIKTGS